MKDKQLTFVRQVIERGIDVKFSQFSAEQVTEIAAYLRSHHQMTITKTVDKDGVYCLHADGFVHSPMAYLLQGYVDNEGGYFKELYIGDNCILSCMEGIGYYESKDQTAKDLFNGADKSFSPFLNYTREVYDPKLVTIRDIMKNLKSFTYQVSFGKKQEEPTAEAPPETPIEEQVKSKKRIDTLVNLWIEDSERLYRYNGVSLSRVRLTPVLVSRYNQLNLVNNIPIETIRSVYERQFGSVPKDFKYVAIKSKGASPGDK